MEKPAVKTFRGERRLWPQIEGGAIFLYGPRESQQSWKMGKCLKSWTWKCIFSFTWLDRLAAVTGHQKAEKLSITCMRFNWLPLCRADAERFFWLSPNKILKNFYIWAAMSEVYSKVQGGQFLPLFRVSATTGIFQPRVCLPDTWNEESLITFYWILIKYK